MFYVRSLLKNVQTCRARDSLLAEWGSPWYQKPSQQLCFGLVHQWRNVAISLLEETRQMNSRKLLALRYSATLDSASLALVSPAIPCPTF